MKHNTVQFFSLPLESKAKVAVRGNGFEGFGHHYSRASSGKLDWAESMILVTQPPQDRNMEMWPTNPPTFRSVFHVHLSIDDLPMPRPNSVSSTTRDALEVYSVEMIDLAMRLLGFMAADLGVEQEALLDAFTGKRQSMAIHYYPPCRHREKVMGITPHTDGLGLTLLLHVKDIMRTGDGCPVLKEAKTTVQGAIFAMTKAKAGAVALVDAKGKLTGIFTDGDFRRSALTGGDEFLKHPVSQFMTRSGKSVSADALAVEALKLFQQFKISDLFAVDAKGRPAGYIDVQDLPKLKIL